MAHLQIKVGASLDANALTLFAPVERVAARARDNIAKGAKQSANAEGREAERAAKEKIAAMKKADRWAAQAAAQGERLAKQAADAVAKAERQKVKEVEKSARERVKLEQQAMREVERMLEKDNRARDRAGAAANRPRNAQAATFGRRVGYWTMRNFAPVTPTLDMGRRIAGDVMRGAGVRTDFSSYVSSFIERQKLAGEISASAYMPGAAGANGVRQNPGDIMREANAVANQTAMDPTRALAGMQAFVGKTGDLETARAVMGDLAKLSRATGTNLEDMVGSAGDAANALGDVHNKGELLYQVMRQATGQGKTGAVEIRDLAKQMAGLAAVAPQFGGNRAAAIGEMGILAQETRQLGGAKSAAQAVTSVQSFVNTFSKGARIRAFAAEGIALRNKSGELYSPEAIITTALRKTGGDSQRMGNLFQDARARSAVRGFETIYHQAGGGDKGLQAVHDEFVRLRKATMDTAEVDESFAKSMQTAEAKAQIFQNRLQTIADKVTTDLIPAMEKLGPLVLRSADAFGSFLTWAANNPGGAITTALGVSIAKAGIENIIRGQVEKAFMAPGVGKVAGTIGAAGTIAALAIATVTIGEAYIDNFFTKKVNDQRADVGKQLAAENLVNRVASHGGAATPEERAALEKQLAELGEKRSEKMQALQSGGSFLDMLIGGAARGMPFARSFGGGEALADEATEAGARQRQMEYESVAKEYKRVADILQSIKDGGIPVTHIPNTPSADPGGRASGYSAVPPNMSLPR